MATRAADPLARVSCALARAACIAVFAEAALVLLGWQVHSERLRSVVPGLVAMNPMTAVAFLLAAGALWLLLDEPGRSWRRWPAAAGALAIALVGLLKLLSFIGPDVGIDQLLFRSELAAYTPPNRMAPNTALGFSLTGAALLVLDVETADGRRPAQILAVVTTVLSLFALIGYAYGVRYLYAVLSYIPMGLNTALSFLLVSGGTFFARPDRGLAAIATGEGAGGVTVRRLVPPAVAIPALAGWLALEGQRAGLYDTAFGVSLLALVSILVPAVLIWRTGDQLTHADTARRLAEAERERLYQAAEDARGRTRAVLDAVGEGVVFLSPDGRIASVNRRFPELLGLSPAGLLGRGAADLRSDVARLLVDPALLTPAQGGGIADPSARAGTCERGFHGKALEIFSAPVAGLDDQHLGRLYAIRDVTAQREVERLKEERHRQLEEELARAAQLQADLLPRDVPYLPGLELAARCLPAREVGGDFFDWHEAVPGILTLTLGDVMGKGMPAALLMATVRAALEAVAQQSPPALAVETVAAALERDLDRSASFITLFHAQIDVAARRVEFVDAGHGHVLLRRAGGWLEELGPRGLPLGVLPGPSYQKGSVILRPGDAMVVYSDGLLDARPELELTPLTLADSLTGARSALDMVDRLVALAAPDGPLPDDLTMVVVFCREEE